MLTAEHLLRMPTEVTLLWRGMQEEGTSFLWNLFVSPVCLGRQQGL